MSYKTAACCLVALTITLFFATSKAEFDIEEAKDLVRKLLNRFIRRVLENGGEDLEGLVDISNTIGNDQMLRIYISDVAKDTGTCARLSTHIDKYKNTFAKLLGNIKKEEPEGKKIPMHVRLNNIYDECNVTLWTLGNAERQLLLTSLASLTLRDHFQDSDGVNINKVDKFGFKINKGILEVKKMIDVLLQFAMDKKCKDLTTLKEFGKEMLSETTEFWKAFFDIAPKYPVVIQGYIREYNKAFDQILEDAGENRLNINIPMADSLNILLNHSRRGSGASSSRGT